MHQQRPLLVAVVVVRQQVDNDLTARTGVYGDGFHVVDGGRRLDARELDRQQPGAGGQAGYFEQQQPHPGARLLGVTALQQYDVAPGQESGAGRQEIFARRQYQVPPVALVWMADPADDVVVDRSQILGEGQKPPVGQQRDCLHAFVAPGVNDVRREREWSRHAGEARAAIPGRGIEHNSVVALEADQKTAPRKQLDLFGVPALPGYRIAIVVAQSAHPGGPQAGQPAARIQLHPGGQPMTLIGDRGELPATWKRQP